MGKPAARVGDMHVCPMVTPGLPPIPHIGGPILPPGTPTVLIGGLPAAGVGSMCTCVGPPDSIIMGSVGVLIGGKPAARMGDNCAHGGTIVLGCPTVMIGEISPPSLGGMAAAPPAEVAAVTSSLPPATAAVVNTAVTMIQAAESGVVFTEVCQTCKNH